MLAKRYNVLVEAKVYHLTYHQNTISKVTKESIMPTAIATTVVKISYETSD